LKGITMAKIHEILAAEPNVKAKADTLLKEGMNTFKEKQGHFLGQERTYQPREEGGEELPDENQEVVTTVPEKLDYVFESLIERLDLIASKEQSNTGAMADVEIDGVVILPGVCATNLLMMEKELKNWRDLILGSPTLKPGVHWNYDEKLGHYKTNPIKTVKNKKVQDVLIKYEATKEHPAQTELISKDVVVGDWITVLLSGAVPPKQKSDWLGRLDKLIIAVKKARQRANDILAADVKYGQILKDYIFND
jgi:hypothetical protein